MKGKCILPLLCLIGLFCLSGFVHPVQAAGTGGLKQIWWINVPGLTLDEVRKTDLPHLKHLMKTASVGAMNMKTGGRGTVSNSYATLGSGTRAVASGQEMFYHPDERMDEELSAGLLYTRRMGMKPAAGSVIYPGIISYIHENEASGYIVAPGILGETLRQRGFSTLVLGNLDEGTKPVRYAPLLTMDKKGVTEEGEIGRSILKSDATRPYGVKTDYGRIKARLASWTKPGLAAVELGDLYRLDRVGDKMFPAVRKEVQQITLREVDHFLGELLNMAGEEHLLVLTSTGTGVAGKEGLFPVLLHRQGEAPGLLTSTTTRRTGVVSNIDLVPTLLTWLGIDAPDEVLGQPMRSVAGSMESFWETVDRMETIYSLRPSVLYSYILLQMLVLMTGLTLILKKGRARSWMESVLLAVMLTPFLFLIISGMTAYSWWLFSGLLVLAGLGLSFLLTRVHTIPLFLCAGLLGFLPVVADGLLGGPLIQQSFLGYDPIKGARYYGIGNEYMGVVLGSSILACAAWLEKRSTDSRKLRLGVGLFFVALLIFFAAPFWGTNAGGALASAVGFSVAYLRFFQARWDRGTFFKMAGLAILGLLILVALNRWLPGQHPSHIGRALQFLEGGNLEEITHIINRKLEMNLKLIRVSSWGKVFLLSLLAMAVLSVRPAGGLRQLIDRYPQLFNGFTAILAGSLAALAFNDSGIVSAATAVIYVVMPVMILGMREWMGNPGADEADGGS